MPYLELNPASIATLMQTTYDDIRADPELFPVFNAPIGQHRPPLLDRMVDFWSTIMLGSRSFLGNVFGKHLLLQGVTADHFLRWLALFEHHTARLFAPDAADEFMVVARRIAGSLQHGFFGKVLAD